MIKRKQRRQRKLSHEILGMIAFSLLLALLLGLFLSHAALRIAEAYCFYHDIPMTEFDWISVDRWVISASALLSAGAFAVLFLALLNGRITYIRKITAGIEALRAGQKDAALPLEGSNELTELAGAINEMSDAQQRLREKEQALAQEKEQLIRSLSHDIRTPLTAILSYSDYMLSREQPSPAEQKEYLQLIQKKAGQIRDLTSVLLDGGKRNPEYFEDGRLLLEQIVSEFAEELEEQFDVRTDLSGCTAFSGTFDVQELRRIFDNLCSNIQKYADPSAPVVLAVSLTAHDLTIRQHNAVKQSAAPSEGYQIGLNSIRRIVQHYAGSVTLRQTPDTFAICITLSEF